MKPKHRNRCRCAWCRAAFMPLEDQCRMDWRPPDNWGPGLLVRAVDHERNTITATSSQALLNTIAADHSDYIAEGQVLRLRSQGADKKQVARDPYWRTVQAYIRAHQEWLRKRIKRAGAI